MENTFNAILVLLALSVVAVAIFRRFNFPSILGYLTVGILVGSHLFGDFFGLVDNSEQTRHLAEYGIVFLLFTVGLEFSFAKLVAMKSSVFGYGSLQVITTTLVGVAIALLLGSRIIDAAIIGSVVAMSSTAIVIKQLNEQLELNSRHGRAAVSILIFQDLAVVIFLIAISFSQDPNALSLFYSILAFLLMVATGRWLLRPLFRLIASARSNELFMLAVLLVTLTAAWTSNIAGLSLSLGAFLAGIMLAETEFRHQIEANIRPFRDILLGLFFITVGMLLNVKLLADSWYIVLSLVAMLIILKAVIITALGSLFKLEPGVAVRSGLSLAQGGEFGFVIITLAINNSLLNEDTGQILLAVIVTSMIIAPFLIRYNGVIAKMLFRKSYIGNRQQNESTISAHSRELSNHVVICGYGRVGQNIARFIDMQQIAYIALDTDPYVIRHATEAGDNVCFGDTTHREILQAANAKKASAVVVSFENPVAAYKILEYVKEINPQIPILVRAADDVHLESFLLRGATEVVAEKFEASLMLVAHLLLILNIDAETIKHRINEVRKENYLLLRSFFHADNPGSIDQDPALRSRLHTVVLTKNAASIGKSIEELDLASSGVIVTAIKRGAGKTTKPQMNMVLLEDDVLVLFGKSEDIEHAESKLLTG